MHIAVMVGYDLLYILFGADLNHLLLNDVQILNVTSMVWLNISATNTTSSPILPSGGDASSSSSSSLSAGAIAGAVIGGVAGVKTHTGSFPNSRTYALSYCSSH